jgi:hypothetical protein
MLVVVAVRIRFLDLPLERDEGEYAYGAQLLLRGGLPFRDLYTLKLPGAHAAYVPAFVLFGQTKVAIRLGLLAVSLATAWLLYLVGRRLSGKVGGLSAATLYLGAASSLSVLGLFAHATQFLVLPVVAGVLALLVAREKARAAPWLVLAGALFGLAVIVKQHAAVFAVFGAAVALGRRWPSWRRGAGEAALLLGGAAVPLILLVLAFLAAGAFEPFWLWCFRYAPQYVSMMPLSRGLHVLGLRLLDISGSLPFLVGLALWGGLRSRRSADPALLLGWLLASIAAVCPGLYFRQHYFVPLLPVASVLAGMGAADLLARGRLFRILVPALVLGSAVFPLWHDRLFLLERSLPLAMRRLYGPDPFAESEEVARYLREHAQPGDTVAIMGSEPQILFLSRLPSAIGYMYSYPWMEPHDLATWMQRDVIRRVTEAPPRWIVLVSVRSSWWEPTEGVETPIFDWMDRFLPAHYDPVGVADIVSPTRTIYLWDEAVRIYEARSRSAVWVYRRRDA